MIRTRITLLALLLPAGWACSSPTTSPIPVETPKANTPTATVQAELLELVGADFVARPCSDNTAAAGCVQELWHASSSQLVRVFVVPVHDPTQLSPFVDKLGADVLARGGVAERIEQSGLVLLRYLEETSAMIEGQKHVLASINYALVGRDQRAVHLVTSVVPFAQQQDADARVRALFAQARFVKSAATP